MDRKNRKVYAVPATMNLRQFCLQSIQIYMYVTCILWKHKTLRILLATEIYSSLWNLQFQKLSKLTVICQGKHSCISLKKTFVCTRYVHVILDLSPFGIFNKK